MANNILIIHGYSDGAQSFTILRDFFVKEGLYSAENVSYVSYASLEDTAWFQNFFDKLDEDYTRVYWKGPNDLTSHSSGFLVVLALCQKRLIRQVSHGQPISNPLNL